MKIDLLWRSAALTMPAVILCWFSSAAPMSIDEVVALALRVNPQVRAARARWNSAMHSVQQNYAPADPIFTYSSLDSPTNGIDHASAHALQGNASFQFPGKALLQAESAKRSGDKWKFRARPSVIESSSSPARSHTRADSELAQLARPSGAPGRRAPRASAGGRLRRRIAGPRDAGRTDAYRRPSARRNVMGCVWRIADSARISNSPHTGCVSTT